MNSFKCVAVFFLTLLLFLGGCSDESNILKVGTIAGPETDLYRVAKNVAKEKFGLNVKLVTFGDYTLLNMALADGAIDANIFQHKPYLIATNKTRGYDLVSVGKTFIYPMGIYSDRFKDLNQLPEGAVVALPNDPTNEARALSLLQQAGLIQLSTQKNVVINNSITSNPKRLQIKRLNAAQLPRVLQEVDLAIINTNYATPAGLVPSKDALFLDSKDSKYANIIAVRAEDKHKPAIKDFVVAVQSPEVIKKVHQLFGSEVIVAWENHSRFDET